MNQGQNLEFPFWNDEDIRLSCAEWYNNSFTVIPSNHTGSCLFEALGDPVQTRLDIVKHMEANWNEYKDFCIEDDYLNKMRLPGTYGGTAEIQAYSQMNDKNVIIIQAQTQRILCEWIVNDQQYVFLELAPNPDSEFSQRMTYNRYNKLLPKTNEFNILHDLHAFQRNLEHFNIQPKVTLIQTPQKQPIKDLQKIDTQTLKEIPLKGTEFKFRSCLRRNKQKNSKIKKQVSFKDLDNENIKEDQEELELKFEIVNLKPKNNIQHIQIPEEPIEIKTKKPKKKKIAAYKSKKKLAEEEELRVLQKRKQIYDEQTSDIDTLLKKYKS